jgi:hypothetical protein
VFGVPHGALDPLVGRALLEPRLGRRWWPAFHGAYLGGAGAVLAGWALAPATTLGAFLAASAVHFGLGDVERGRSSRAAYAAEVLVRGALPIVGPAAAFPQDVARLFGWLVPADARGRARALAGGARRRRPAGARAGRRGGDRRAARRRRAGGAPVDEAARARHLAVAAEVASLARLVAAAPPLVAFLVYFCGWHSTRHTLDLAARLDPHRPARALAGFARLGAGATAVTLVGAAAAWRALRPAAGDVPAAVRTLFVGLSALTFPHMALTALAARGERAPRPRRRPRAR